MLLSLGNVLADSLKSPFFKHHKTVSSLTDFFPLHEEAESTLFTYLAMQRPISKPDGILTIATNNTYDLGDSAYAKIITELLIKAYPDKKIRVIIEASNENIKNIKATFHFPSSVETLVFVEGDEEEETTVAQWLNEASLIIVASTLITALHSGRHQYISFQQLSNTPTTMQQSIETLTEMLENYYALYQQLPTDWGTRHDLERNFWGNRSEYYPKLREVLDYPDEHLSNTEAVHGIAKDIIASCSSDSDCSEYFQTKSGKTVTENEDLTRQPASSSTFGFEPDNLGFLLKPSLLKSLESSTTIPLANEFQELLSDYPAISRLILNTDKNPDFYMAYMHNTLGFAEFIAIVSHLTAESTPVILANVSRKELENSVLKQLLANNGISEVIHTNLKDKPRNSQDEVYNIGYGGKRVHIVTLPIITDDLRYLSLFSHARHPVGVTGNLSLFNAVALKKVPYYDITHGFQSGVNDSLKRFDQTGKLHGVFDNRFLPLQKARAIESAKNSVNAWADDIMETKLANQLLLSMIDYLITDRGQALFGHLAQLENLPNESLTEYEQDIKRTRNQLEVLFQTENQQCPPLNQFYKLYQSLREAKSVPVSNKFSKRPFWLFYESAPRPDCEH
ncbi:hypothetical protein EOPP23_12800 [Endozoicomonas sp. OPT23]|uniref:hypothetical protein n=1 Tax=Endozoicomonas sp. OPT23 TaxID=2072845 RepID=UPI001890C0BF|nr:hypothetical protein [Endozoicomonas sp. OPT23]MRI33866.1 hypothetical protein [Endozoicomonas sp. OPT23]